MPEESAKSPPLVHPVARSGYGRAAEAYRRARPSYPDAAIDWLLAAISARAGGDEVVEIGAGTGNFTSMLVARGVHVIAVEPVAAMRERLRGLGPTVQAIDATAEALPFPSGSRPCLVASQSLHWCDVPRALREFDRVLAPAGAVGLIWNFRDLDVPWQRDLDRLLTELRGDAPHSRDGRWERGLASSAFIVQDSEVWRWSHTTDLHGVRDRVHSVSYVAALPEEQRDRVDRLVLEILARHSPGETDIAFPYVTEAYVLRRAS